MTTTTQAQPNLVPTIESSMLPSTPAHEWAEKMTGELDTSAERVGAQAPKNREELVPGSYPGEREEEEDAAGGETLMPAEEDVQQTITSVGQMVKDMLPEALKAYLPSSSPPSSTTPQSAASTNTPPFLNESTAVDSRTSTTTNLSTEAQAGSLLPPRLDSESIPDIVEESDTLATPRTESVSLPAVPLSVVSNPPVPPGLSDDPNADGASSHLSTRVHTGSSASPNPVLPSLPIPAGPNSNAGLDHSSSSRFIERLSSSSSVTPESQSTSQSSPKPPLVERGGPNVLATPPAGVLPPELTPTEDEDEEDDEEEGEGGGEGEGDSEEKRERKRDRLVRKLKEKMHVGGA
ncbi:hypothetical protein C8F01DRAFT_1174579 [Mycena amicta]|nr:hypothetical protein C8F01DRAFT_1174579 [Mycena amicta]